MAIDIDVIVVFGQGVFVSVFILLVTDVDAYGRGCDHRNNED